MRLSVHTVAHAARVFTVKRLSRLLGWLAGCLLLIWRLTCRYKVLDDPRPALRASGCTYIYALLHAHQLAALFVNDDRRMAAMVSRSTDGDLLAPSLILRRVTPVRGSSRSRGRDKGGREAWKELAEHVRRGIPALFAVDGPRGPRNYVHRGVADLAFETDAPVLPVMVLPSRRWVLTRAWDRFQVPKPLCVIRLIFGSPLHRSSFDSADAMVERLSEALNSLETLHDPEEATLAHGAQRDGPCSASHA
jgi:lysophospholipid acyltransferase (LPLAT)-like uncharacterized protein